MALPQPLHIFRKDLRHLWPETLVTLVLFVAFAWAAPASYSTSDFAPYLGLLSGFLHLLMPIAWLVVISRLIHDEPLVGDRQFWTSRPYHWATLLAAKVLYLLAFLYLPFFLMQVYLLKHAGLYPTTAIPALLHNLLLLTVIIVVPLTAIAAVTSTFARLLLSVLGRPSTAHPRRWRPVRLPGLPAHAAAALQPVITDPRHRPARRCARLPIRHPPNPHHAPCCSPPRCLSSFCCSHARHRAYSPASYPLAGDAPKLPPSRRLPPRRNRPLRCAPRIGRCAHPGPAKVRASTRNLPTSCKASPSPSTRPAATGLPRISTSTASRSTPTRPVTVAPFLLPRSVFNKIHDTPVDVHLSLAADQLKTRHPGDLAGYAPALQRPWPRHLQLLRRGRPERPSHLPLPPQDPGEHLRLRTALRRTPAEPPAARSVVRPDEPQSHQSLHPRLRPRRLRAAWVPLRTIRSRRIVLPSAPEPASSFVEAKSQGRTRLEVDQKQLLLERLRRPFATSERAILRRPPFPE